jgi:hypothetical protein
MPVLIASNVPRPPDMVLNPASSFVQPPGPTPDPYTDGNTGNPYSPAQPSTNPYTDGNTPNPFSPPATAANPFAGRNPF